MDPKKNDSQETDSQKTVIEEYSPPAEPTLRRTDVDTIDPYRQPNTQVMPRSQTTRYNDMGDKNNSGRK